MTIAKKLQLLRNEMVKNGIDMYLVPSIDAHNSEYVPECWQRRPWISGFDGSAGEVLITLDAAYLWTDGRYFLQAEQQLDSSVFTLMKQQGFVAETEVWLANNSSSKKLGIDPRLVGIGRTNKLQEIMDGCAGKLVVLADNLIDNCKQQLNDVQAIPNNQAYAQPINYTGLSTADKLAWLRTELANNHVNWFAFNVLDEVAWLFNVRGADIEYNPLVISYALIGEQQAIWFVDLTKVSGELKQELASSGVELLDYNQFGDYVAQLNSAIGLDDKTASFWMLQQAQVSNQVKLFRSPIVYKKAVKNAVEQDGTRFAHQKDAAAMVNFIYWLEQNWQTGVDELIASDKLADFRAQQDNLRGLSFATISGYAANGAIIHYRSTPATNKVIKNDSLYLLDSGGQYLEGTTDTTRTFHLGEPSAELRRHYTLVLKGHLALSRAKFPHGTCGENLDVLARTPLWNELLNYRHGTGHGVGSFLCVHEGPQRISQAFSGVALVPGMIVSNEPGFYFDGNYGIRIENLCLVTKVDSDSEYGPFYQFEDLTLIPYCKRLIDVSLLSDEDRQQVITYYERIKTLVLPRVTPEIQSWLLNELDLF